MIKEEWKKIFHNPWMMIVLVAVILIPSIYACVFLGSMWDPYGSTKNMPVAVVNNDKSVMYNDQELDIGNELVDQLKDNDAMNFQCVTEDVAKKGLEDGKYYMIVEIPSDFSHNATTLLDEQPQKMILNYITNPGSNYIATKIDDSAIAKMKEKVSHTVTQTYAETLFSQIHKLSDGLTEACDGTTQLQDGTQQLLDGNQEISRNLQVLASSSIVFKDGAQQLEEGLKNYVNGVSTVDKGLYTLNSGIQYLNQSTGSLSQGVQQLNQGAGVLNQGVQQYTQGVQQAYTGSQLLVKQNQKLQDGSKKLSQGTKKLYAGSQNLNKGVKAVETAVTSSTLELNQYTQLIETLKAKGMTELANRITSEGLKLSSLDSATQGLLNKFGVTSDLPSAYQVVQKSSSGMSQMKGAIAQLSKGSQELVGGLNQIDASVNGGQYYEMKNGQLVPVKVAPNESLNYGIQAYTAGVSQVDNGLGQLTQKNNVLQGGSQQLAQGINSLHRQTPALVQGVNDLSLGSNKLYGGTQQLVANNSKLLGGSQQLNQGSSKIKDGSQQLADGSLLLGSGLNEVKGGLSTLNEGLKDGAKQSKLSTDDKTWNMMAEPVQTANKEISTVENNGHAMAPYMMSVALYVCGLALTLMYPIRDGISKAKSGLRYWVSKATVMFGVSTLSAVVMISSLKWILDFQPQHLLQAYLFAALVSAAFMALIVFLNMTTGYIGEFLLLVFMIINLGGSAGTYPIETSSKFFKMFHNFVPYTYSVNGFRKIISMPNASITTEVIVFVSILVVFSVLTIIYFYSKKDHNKHLIPQAFEEKSE